MTSIQGFITAYSSSQLNQKHSLGLYTFLEPVEGPVNEGKYDYHHSSKVDLKYIEGALVNLHK